MATYYRGVTSPNAALTVASADVTYDTKMSIIFAGVNGQLPDGAIVHPGDTVRIAAQLFVMNPGGANDGYGIGGARIVLTMTHHTGAPYYNIAMTTAANGVVTWDVTDIVRGAPLVGMGVWTANAEFAGQLPSGLAPGMMPSGASVSMGLGIPGAMYADPDMDSSYWEPGEL